MDDCMWDVLPLSEEGGKSRECLVNHQIHETQTRIEAVQAKRQDLTHVAAEFFEFHYGKTGKPNLGNVCHYWSHQWDIH